ncbi:MAG TPA: acyl carrier protein [Mycobacteriales bacterium]|nr:acyl carrier protein [Mycobacteriales bacterium]
MDRAQVIEVLVAKAAELLGTPDLQEGDSFTGRGVDSLAVVEWVMDVEDAVGVELTEAEVLAVPSVGALADVIMAKLA